MLNNPRGLAVKRRVHHNRTVLPLALRLRRVFRRYIAIHGPLLAKGLSFSALFATVPLLFLLSAAGSLALTPEVQVLLEDQLFRALPDTARRSVVSGMERLAANPGSLSIVTVGVFLWSVHQLFFDLHRVARAAFGLPVSPARGRARAMGLSGLFLLLIYATALLSLGARLVAPYVAMPQYVLQLLALLSAAVILSVVLWSLLRLASGVPMTWRRSIAPVIIGALLWYAASTLAGSAVRLASRRLIVYGVLASSVLFLLLMRVYAEILLHTALWINDLTDHPPKLDRPPTEQDRPALD